MSVVTATQAKTYLGMTTTEDATIQPFIDAAEAAIANKVGPLVSAATASRVRGYGSRLILPVPPVRSVTSITGVSGSTVTVADVTVVQSTGVVEFIYGGVFAEPWYDVIYQAGNAADANSLPKDLYDAVLELVRHLWGPKRGPSSRPGAPASDAASNTLPGAAYLFPFRVQELIAPYMQAGLA